MTRKGLPAVRNISWPSSAGFLEPDTGAYRIRQKPKWSIPIYVHHAIQNMQNEMHGYTIFWCTSGQGVCEVLLLLCYNNSKIMTQITFVLQCLMEIDKRFTSRNRAPVALTCSLINLEVAPSTVETSTYLQISIQSKRLDTLWPARCGKF